MPPSGSGHSTSRIILPPKPLRMDLCNPHGFYATGVTCQVHNSPFKETRVGEARGCGSLPYRSPASAATCKLPRNYHTLGPSTSVPPISPITGYTDPTD